MSPSLIARAESGRKLGREEAEALMEMLLSGQLETQEIVRLLRALNTRPFEIDELVGFARVMRRHAARAFADGEPLPANMVDTCGTGGDGLGTFNISTAAAILASAGGARVAKHGNRAASSRSGSADVLEALGVRVDLPMQRAGRGIREIGIGFLYAPTAHSAARHAAAARKEIGVRTIFNLLGPLTNPAGAQSQVLGVFSEEAVELIAGALAQLGTERAFVLHGAGGLDEISLAGETLAAEVRHGEIRRVTLTPEQFGLDRAPIDAIRGGTPSENAAITRRVLDGETGPLRDIVVINAAAALTAAGVAADFRDAAEIASESLRSGKASEKLDELVRFTNQAND